MVASTVVEDPLMVPAAERYAQGRLELDNLVSQYVDDPMVRQIFVNRFETGDFYSSLETRLAEAGQFVVTGIPMASIMGYHALGAYTDSQQKGTTFSDEWGSRGNDIDKALESTYKALDTTFGLTGEGTLNPTMKIAFNNEIHKELQTKLDNNEITEEQYNSRAMIELEDGTLQKKG